jgi:hypothetical protein
METCRALPGWQHHQWICSGRNEFIKMHARICAHFEIAIVFELQIYLTVALRGYLPPEV